MSCQLILTYLEDHEEDVFLIKKDQDLFGLIQIKTNDYNETLVSFLSEDIKILSHKKTTLIKGSSIKVNANNFSTFAYPVSSITFNNKTIECIIILYMFENEPPKGFEIPTFPG